MLYLRYFVVVMVLFLTIFQNLLATKFVEVKVVDKNYLQISFKDGDVNFVDDGLGETAFLNLAVDPTNNFTVTYGAALNTSNAVSAANWKIVSTDDPNYGTTGLSPQSCYRKSKVNGMQEGEWNGSDFNYSYTMEHTIYLRLPFPMVQGKSYTLQINVNTNTDVTSKTFTYDIYNSRSEAVHVNLVGYLAAPSVKAADLYLWLGNGGARDYSSFVGNAVYIYNVATKTPEKVGTVSFWKSSAGEAQGYNFTQSNVWNADFTSFNTPGTYRIAIDGVGCSEDFKIQDDIYYEPFKVNLLGYFYMRIGQKEVPDMPVTRRPLFIPNVDPANTTVYITTKTDLDGLNVDNGEEWAPFSTGRKNPNAWGGHSDAADWDRDLGHNSSVWDMLLPYIITNGSLSDDNLGIAESGNGIPDIIDEARYEVDFWLRLRDGKGYGHGIPCPAGNNVLYQEANSPIAAWFSAANSAMLSEAFRIAGKTTLMNTYRDSAINAYNYASSLADQQLEQKIGIGIGFVKGRDLKMMAAAYLYNVTGDVAYESVINAESKVTNSTSTIVDWGNYNHLYATAAYLKTNRTINYPTLYSNMKASVINEAKNQEANYSNSRPSRRATDESNGWFHTEQNVQRTILAHAIASTQADKDLFQKALILEADWGLGRNPANLIQMTTASTNLSSKRSVEQMYTTGRDDGSPGLHPGHTPYMNTEDWGGSMIMNLPSWLTSKSYPSNAVWPKAEQYFNTRYLYAHAEFTPQQTMRGKQALYEYLYALGGTPFVPVLVTGVTLNTTTATINGNMLQLVATIAPVNATNTNVTWSSSDPSVATVNSKGLVVGLANGTATITVTTKDGAKTASATITVTSPSKGQVKKVMPLGDSVTEGYEVPGGYRAQLWRNLVGVGLTCGIDLVGSLKNNATSDLGDPDHEGHSGWRIDEISANINNYMDMAKPDIVLCQLGTNDLAHGDIAVAPARYKALAEQICAKLPAGGKLYLSTITQFGARGSEPTATFNNAVPGIVADLKAAGKPVYFVDAYNALNADDISDDFTHPNQQGCNKLGDFWFNVIKDDIEQVVLHYSLTTNATAGGTVTKTPDRNDYGACEYVTLTANPSAGYKFTGWSGDTVSTVNPIRLNLYKNTTITANFTTGTNYKINITAAHGSVIKTPNLNGYNIGDVVTIAEQHNRGYKFTGWSGDVSGSTSPTSIVVTGNMNVTANYDEAPDLPVYTDAGGIMTSIYKGGGGVLTRPKDGNAFEGTEHIRYDYKIAGWWDGFQLRFDATEINQVNLVLGVKGPSSANNYCTVALVDKNGVGGPTYRLPRTDAYTLVTIPIDSLSEGVDLNNISMIQIMQLGGESGSGTVYFDRVIFTGLATPQPSTLTTNATAGGTLTKSPSKTSYLGGELVTLTANPNTGYKFTGWSGDASGTTNPLTITMNKNMSITANFAAGTPYTITTNVSNGSITKSPNLNGYNIGDVVTLTATSNSGYKFSNWTGDAGGSDNPVNITVTGNNSVTAVMVPAADIPIYTDAGTPYINYIYSANGTLTEETGAAAYEGNKHYHYDYEIAGWWDGIQINLFPIDISPLKNLVIAFNGPTNAANRVEVTLTDKNGVAGTSYTLTRSTSYALSTIPISSLLNAAIDPTNITTISFLFQGGESGVGTVYFDNIIFKGTVGSGVSVTSVSVAPSSAVLNEGSTQLLAATVLPDNATNKNVIWSSSNTSVATVSPNGLVTALAAGYADITASSVDGANTTDGPKTAKAAITVAGVVLTSKASALVVGTTEQLTATVLPTNAANKSVTWSSSNPDVATVSSTGLVTGISAGNAIITLTAVGSGKKASIDMAVYASLGTNIALNKSTTSSSEEGANPATKINDNSLSTRWAAINGNMPQWVTIDLEGMYDISAFQYFFEFPDRAFYYIIETSSDNTSWTTITDKTKNGTLGNQINIVTALKQRYVRITVTNTENPGNTWASMFEFRVFGTPAANKQSQTITFNALPAKKVNDAAFTISATASSGLPVTFSSSDATIASISGSTVTIKKAGTVTITATQVGNASWAAVSKTQTLTITKQSQVITFNALPDKKANDAPFAISATASSGLAVTFTSSDATIASITGNTVTPLKVGTVTIMATQAGDANWSAASALQNLTITKKAQTITFNALPAKKANDAPFTISATATSGLAVVFASSDPSIASISGNTITLHKEGTVTITASQAGDDAWGAASPVAHTLNITTATGIGEEKENSFNVYPNPVADILYIKGDGTENMNVSIFNLVGTKVWSGVVEKQNINVSKLPAGVYVLKMKNNKVTQTIRFVKQ